MYYFPRCECSLPWGFTLARAYADFCSRLWSSRYASINCSGVLEGMLSSLAQGRESCESLLGFQTLSLRSECCCFKYLNILHFLFLKLPENGVDPNKELQIYATGCYILVLLLPQASKNRDTEVWFSFFLPFLKKSGNKQTIWKSVMTVMKQLSLSCMLFFENKKKVLTSSLEGILLTILLRARLLWIHRSHF